MFLEVEVGQNKGKDCYTIATDEGPGVCQRSGSLVEREEGGEPVQFRSAVLLWDVN